MEFSAWLQQEMNGRQWSQSELARRSGINQSTISQLLSGKRGPGEETCKSIARAFNYPPEFVFQKAFLDVPSPSIEQTTLNELENIMKQLPPEERAKLIQIGWVLVENARNVENK